MYMPLSLSDPMPSSARTAASSVSLIFVSIVSLKKSASAPDDTAEEHDLSPSSPFEVVGWSCEGGAKTV